MILLIIFITLLVAGAILIIIANKKLWWEDRFGTVIASCSVGALTIGILGLTVVITCNLIQNTSIAIANKKTEYQMTVSSLNNTYQAYMDRAANYEAISVVQYNEQVREFKTDIITNQRALNNPWINIFVSNAYKDFDANAVQYIGNYIG